MRENLLCPEQGEGAQMRQMPSLYILLTGFPHMGENHLLCFFPSCVGANLEVDCRKHRSGIRGHIPMLHIEVRRHAT